MNFAEVIREVGRGAQGSRPLDSDRARELFGALLNGDVPDLETGALLAALRMKGESDAELLGFFRAAQESVRLVLDVEGAVRPVVLPSYNGARRQANLTPFLAQALDALGVPVVVHGPGAAFGRITSAALLQASGTAVLGGPGTPFAAGGGPRFLAIEDLSPGLSRLLSLRARLGLRNAAHSVVKLIDPFAGRGLVVTPGTHPPYLASMRAIAHEAKLNVLLLRATEGEPYANPRRRPAMELISDGQSLQQLDGEHESLATLPVLPASIEIEDTLVWGKGVLEGRIPMPAPLAVQAALCLVGCGASGGLAEARSRVAERFAVARGKGAG